MTYLSQKNAKVSSYKMPSFLLIWMPPTIPKGIGLPATRATNKVAIRLHSPRISRIIAMYLYPNIFGRNLPIMPKEFA